MTHYERLGVESHATPEALKKAYRAKAFALHPDRNPGNKSAEEEFKLAAEAYNVLSDHHRRQAYDYSMLAPPPAGWASTGYQQQRGAPAFDPFDLYREVFKPR